MKEYFCLFTFPVPLTQHILVSYTLLFFFCFAVINIISHLKDNKSACLHYWWQMYQARGMGSQSTAVGMKNRRSLILTNKKFGNGKEIEMRFPPGH
jgi:hypothetical protein